MSRCAPRLPRRPDAVFFDVDGVLLDSLPPHLAFCRDKAAAYGLDVAVPDAAAFKALARGGTKISPMREFLTATGFPPHAAERAAAEYADFSRAYRSEVFPGAQALLDGLAGAGTHLGLVTANIRANVVPPLGAAWRSFDPDCAFFHDDHPDAPRPKAWCLSEGARRLGLEPSRCAYVGDQFSDAAAAAEAGMPFLGAAWGWVVSPDDEGWPVAATPAEALLSLLNV
jgi:phosphoglycolate phosphatase